VKSVFSLGAKHHIRNGESTRFWEDWWQGQGPLKDRYPTLYGIAVDPHVTVAGCCAAEGWQVTFRRGLGTRERMDLNSILAGILGVHLSEGQDVISWLLEPSGKFSVKSLYRKLCQGTPRKHFSDIWKVAVPMKVRIFLWQLVRKCLPSNDNIRRRRGPSTG
jgi:hypothetical protein